MAQPFSSYIVDNDNKFRSAITRAREAVSDLRIPFTLILADFYKSERAIFQLQSAGQYPDFKGPTIGERRHGPLAAGTDRRQPIPASASAMTPYQYYKKKTYGFDYPLLKRTGRLANSLLSASAPGAVAIIGSTLLTIGTTVEYGVYHQSDSPRHKIPLRKFLFIGPEASEFATSDMMGRTERWLNIMNDFVLKKLKASGAHG